MELFQSALVLLLAFLSTAMPETRVIQTNFLGIGADGSKSAKSNIRLLNVTPTCDSNQVKHTLPFLITSPMSFEHSLFTYFNSSSQLKELVNANRGFKGPGHIPANNCRGGLLQLWNITSTHQMSSNCFLADHVTTEFNSLQYPIDKVSFNHSWKDYGKFSDLFGSFVINETENGIKVLLWVVANTDSGYSEDILLSKACMELRKLSAYIAAPTMCSSIENIELLQHVKADLRWEVKGVDWSMNNPQDNSDNSTSFIFYKDNVLKFKTRPIWELLAEGYSCTRDMANRIVGLRIYHQAFIVNDCFRKTENGHVVHRLVKGNNSEYHCQHRRPGCISDHECWYSSNLDSCICNSNHCLSTTDDNTVSTMGCIRVESSCQCHSSWHSIDKEWKVLSSFSNKSVELTPKSSYCQSIAPPPVPDSGSSSNLQFPLIMVHTLLGTIYSNN